MIVRRLAALIAVVTLGCHEALPEPSTARYSSEDLALVTYDATVNAQIAPPSGWKMDPYKTSSEHRHAVWISPSGHTAYGVIYFSLPLPVGYDLTLWGFLREMRRNEGEATLESKKWDSDLNGLRFVARGGRYIVRTNLMVRGFHGWAIYAGTLRNEQIVPEELAQAQAAREQTRIGRPERR
jgi:hypothetical protein